MKRMSESDCELLCIVTVLAVTIISVFSSHLDTLASL